MGLRVLPSNILRRMAPEVRKPLGNAGILPEEVDAQAAKYAERKLQEQCENYLRLRDIFYLRMPMHRSTRIRCGWPDFEVHLRTATLLIEVKVDGGRLSEDQIKLHAEYHRQTGRYVLLVVNYDQFVKLVDSFLADNADAPAKTESTFPVR